jgi:hypothetical protein
MKKSREFKAIEMVFYLFLIFALIMIEGNPSHVLGLLGMFAVITIPLLLFYPRTDRNEVIEKWQPLMEDLGFTYMQRIRNEIEYNYGWMFWKDHDKEMGIYFHGDQDEEESLSFISPLDVTDLLLEYLEKPKIWFYEKFDMKYSRLSIGGRNYGYWRLDSEETETLYRLLVKNHQFD